LGSILDNIDTVPNIYEMACMIFELRKRFQNVNDTSLGSSLLQTCASVAGLIASFIVVVMRGLGLYVKSKSEAYAY